MDYEAIVKIKNCDNYTEKFIVTRPYDGEMWFWGSYEDKDVALEVAKSVGGVYAERRDA